MQNLLCIFGSNALQVSLHWREETSEVEEGVAVLRNGIRHDALGDEAVVLHAVERILEAAALAEACVAVSADVLVGAVNVGLADEE